MRSMTNIEEDEEKRVELEEAKLKIREMEKNREKEKEDLRREKEDLKTKNQKTLIAVILSMTNNGWFKQKGR